MNNNLSYILTALELNILQKKLKYSGIVKNWDPRPETPRWDPGPGTRYVAAGTWDPKMFK